jgi:GAF domain-containing protein
MKTWLKPKRKVEQAMLPDLIRRIFNSPLDSRPEFQRALKHSLRVLLAIFVLLSALEILVFQRPNTWLTLSSFLFIGLATVLAEWQVRKNRLWPAKLLVPFAGFAALVYLLILGNGMHDSVLIAFGVVLTLSAFLLGTYSTFYLGILSILSIGIVTWADMTGRGAPPEIASYTGLDDFIIASVLIALLLIIQRQSQQQMFSLLDELEQSLETQRKTTDELETIKNNLEQIVAERTASLEESLQSLEEIRQQEARLTQMYRSVALIARRITQTASSEETTLSLLDEIPLLISDAFGYYHVGIFLMDKEKRFAILNAANSAAGKRMLEEKHMLPVNGESAVGTAVLSNQPYVLNNLKSGEAHFINPLLPDTRAEAVLPLFVGEEVIGALDLQSTEENAFDESTLEVLEILAEEIAVAVYTSRLLEENRRQIGELQALSRQQVRESWKNIPQQLRIFGYRYRGIHLYPLERPMPVAEIPDTVKIVEQPGSNLVTILAPLKLRNEPLALLEIKANKVVAENVIDTDMIQALAERIALALENALLYEKTTRRAQREHIVASIANALRSTSEPETMLETAIRELKQALGAREVRIIHPDENQP